MTVEQIASGSPTGDRDAAVAASGPNPTAGHPPDSGTANPLAASDDNPPIDHRDAEWSSRATWHMRKIAELERQQHETRRAFDTEIQRLQDRRDETDAMFDKSLEWHRAPLRQLHAAILADDPKWKTITLPYGKLTSRTPVKPTVRVPDTEAFIAWAHINAPHLLEVTFRPDRKHIAAEIGPVFHPVAVPVAGESVEVVTAAGEVVPGITFGLDTTTFSIQMDEL